MSTCSARHPARYNTLLRHCFLGLLLGATLCGQAAPSSTGPEAKPKKFPSEVAVQKSEADQNWDEINGQLTKAGAAKSPDDWKTIQAKARAFKNRHPADSRTAEAEKVEVIAGLKAEAPSANKKKSAASKLAEDFVADKKRPAKDRYEVHFGLKDRNLNERGLRKKPERDAARINDARELALTYPDDPRPFGYMLSLAKGQSGPEAEKLAKEILKSNAPLALKEQAKVLLAQRALVGKPLKVEGLEIERYRGSKVVLYSWSAKRPEIFELIGKCIKLSGVVAIGINVDDDPLPARALTTKISFPGTILFDGGLAGPLASQLKFTHVNSLYIVDEAGALSDVSGHLDTIAKLQQAYADKNADKGGAK